MNSLKSCVAYCERNTEETIYLNLRISHCQSTAFLFPQQKLILHKEKYYLIRRGQNALSVYNQTKTTKACKGGRI